MYPNAKTISSFFHLPWQLCSSGNQAEEGKHIAEWLQSHQGYLLINKPGIGYWEMWALLKEIPASLHRRLLIAQHHELRRDFDLRGLHFSAEAPFSPEDYGGKLLGMTVNSFAEALLHGSKLHYLILHLPADYGFREKHLFKKNFKGKAVLIDMPSSILCSASCKT